MKIFFSFLVAIMILSFNNQQQANPLINTKWGGTDGLQVFFNKTDTVRLIISGKVIAAAQYKVKDSILTWRDYIANDASCDTSIRGTYVYKIKEDVLTFRVLSDKCEERGDILQTLVLIKQ